MTTTQDLAAAATIVGGLLAGGNVDRGVVQMQAWSRVGAKAWADYSRHADLGPGLVLYPIEGIGGALLSVATAIAVSRDSRVRRPARVAANAAALLAVSGLAVTLKAAPKMLSLRKGADEAEALRGFRFWSCIRGPLQVLAFIANVITLEVLYSDSLQKT